MGCAQAKPSNENSPPQGLAKLKSDHGYAGKSSLNGHSRGSSGERLNGSKSRNYKSVLSDGGGKGSGEEGSIITIERKKDGGDDGNGKISSMGFSLSKSDGDDELVDGWPKWLADNISRNVLAKLVPKSVDSYEKIDKVGQGTYSNVYKARDRETGKIVALKKVRFDTSEPESVKFMAREIKILQKLDHPNVVKLEGLATSRMQFSLYLVFEFMQTDLLKIISRPEERLTEPQVKCYMHQLLSGLEHCHENGILHRDIKGANLLIDKNGTLKIADFGLANYYKGSSKHPLTNRVVTLWYRAPELLLGARNYGVGIDLWSAGCLLAEMFTGKPILPGRTEVEQLHRIFKLCGTPSEEYWKKVKQSLAKFRPAQSYKPSLVETFRDLPASSLGLLSKLLALDPAYRGSATLALQNEFFYTSPLACDLSGLPVIYTEDDEIKEANERRKYRNSKMKLRSRTRRKDQDPIAKFLMEEHNDEKMFNSSRQSEEPGSTTASTSSGRNTTMRKESSDFFPSSISSSRMSPRTHRHHDDATEDIKNMPPLAVSRRHTANYKKDDNVNRMDRVRRSVSTREFRNLNQKKQLDLFAYDD